MKLELSSDEVSMVIGMCIAFRQGKHQFDPERGVIDNIINKIFTEDKKTVEKILG